MASTSHHVTFRFRLPPALALRAPLGFWPASPRGCTLDVGEQGNVLVTSVDRLESYARKQVFAVAGAFLRQTDPITQPAVMQRFALGAVVPRARRGLCHLARRRRVDRAHRSAPGAGAGVQARAEGQLQLFNRVAG